MNRRHFTLAGLGGAVVSGFYIPARAQADRTLVLGQSAPFTGPAAQLGVQFHQGAKMAFDQANAQGGTNRYLVEIRTLDDGYVPERCLENTRKLVAEGVFGLFGYVGTTGSQAALPLAVQARMPFFAPMSGALSLRDPANRFAFHLRASYQDETALIVRNLTSLGLDKVGVFYQNTATGKAGLDGVKLALAARNLNTTAEASVERNSADVLAPVKTLLASSPQAIVMVGTYDACAAFFLAARRALYRGKFYCVSFVNAQALADVLGKEAAGVQVTQVVPSPEKLARPVVREFADAIKTTGKSANANFTSMEGYLAARLFLEGLKRAGPKVTRDSFFTGMESIGDLSIGGFNVALSPVSHVASRFVELSVLTVDGQVRT